MQLVFINIEFVVPHSQNMVFKEQIDLLKEEVYMYCVYVYLYIQVLEFLVIELVHCLLILYIINLVMQEKRLMKENLELSNKVSNKFQTWILFFYIRTCRRLYQLRILEYKFHDIIFGENCQINHKLCFILQFQHHF